MNPRSLMMFVMAIVCGLGAMFGANKFMTPKPAAEVETQEILVAARDLKAEEVLRADLVKLVAMPKTSVPAGAFTSVKDVEDRWVQIDLLEGEPILDRKLAAKGTPAGLVARIPKGMRAFAIDVNEQTGVSGFVLPDHKVDVVMTRPSSGRDDGRLQGETILEDVLVLASGQTFSRSDDRMIQARTVTLAVTPDQVDILVAAKSKGTLSLSLRGLNETPGKVKRKAFDISGLTKLAEALRSMPRPVPVPVTPPPPPPEPEPEPAPVVVEAPPPPTPEPPAPAPTPAPAPPKVRYVTILRGPRSAEAIPFGDAPQGEPSMAAAGEPLRPGPFRPESFRPESFRPEVALPAVPALGSPRPDFAFPGGLSMGSGDVDLSQMMARLNNGQGSFPPGVQGFPGLGGPSIQPAPMNPLELAPGWMKSVLPFLAGPTATKPGG